MKFAELLEKTGNEPLFRSSVLLAGEDRPAGVSKQLSRWVRSGRLIQLRRGVYALSKTYRKLDPHPFLVANVLRSGSYVSLQSALSYYDLIPDVPQMVTSVTTGRPETVSNALGVFRFRHVRKSLFYGYRSVSLADERHVYVAEPEKALLDLIYLVPEADDPNYIAELRLQSLEAIDEKKLLKLCEESGSAKLERAVRHIIGMLPAGGGVR